MVKKEIWYVDACILIAAYDKEDNYYPMIQECIKILDPIEKISLCSSGWSITEMVKVLINTKQWRPSRVLKVVEKIMRESRFGSKKIEWLKVHPTKKDYTFDEFFYHLQEQVIKCKGGVPDAVHSVIMANNKLSKIFTTNKEDFTGRKGTIVLTPEEIIKDYGPKVK